MPLKGLPQVKKAIAQTRVNVDGKVKGVYIDTLNAVVKVTPVHFKDGGTLRNNWFLSVGSPSNKKTGKDKSGSGSYSQVSRMPKSILGKKIYFTNNQEYASIVEYGGYPKKPKRGTWTGSGYQNLSRRGFSIQAPSGMVRINLNKAKRALKRL